MWIIGSILGSICLVLLNTLSKLLPVQGTTVLLLGTLSLLTTGCFWYAWKTSPQQFLVVWFLQSGLVSLGSFGANYIIKDSITFTQVLGICLIIFGGLLLVKWTG